MDSMGGGHTERVESDGGVWYGRGTFRSTALVDGRFTRLNGGGSEGAFVSGGVGGGLWGYAYGLYAELHTDRSQQKSRE